MKKVIIAAIALFSMTACNVFEMPQTQMPTVDEGYGYLDLGISSETEMQVVTKAGVLPNEYTIIVEGIDNNYKYEGKYSEFGKTLAAGKYKITATNLTDAEAYPTEGENIKGFVQVRGVANEVVIAAGQTTPCTINAEPINSKVSFKYTENFAKVFPTITSLNVALDSRAFGMTASPVSVANDALDNAFFPAGMSIKWTLDVKMNNGTDKKYENNFTTVIKKWSIVTFDVSETDGNVSVLVEVNDQITEVAEVPVTIDPTQGTEQQ